MSTVTVTQLISADIETVWSQIADVTLVENWHPGVARADLLSDSPTGLGATRRCNFYNGTDVVEEIVDLKEHEFLMEIRDFNGPMKRFESHWSLNSTPAGATQITIKMDYDMKLSILGTALDALLIKGRMSKLLKRVLAGLEHHIVSGETVGKDFAVAA